MKHEIRAHYEARVRPDRENYDILDWGSRASQFARFEVYLNVLRENGLLTDDAPAHRLLDVGCGLTDLCTFLYGCAARVHYVGVDIVPAILREAQRQFPGRAMLLADVFARPPFSPRSFDSAFCSGTLNLEVGNNEQFAANALANMFGLVSTCLITNFLHTRTAEKYPHCHYYDPDTILRSCPPDTARIDIHDQYLENDFTLVLWRQLPPAQA